MPLILDEEQEMLRDAARGFLAEKAPVAAFRSVRDNKPDEGFCRELWAEMIEMGWAGIIVDEAYGGSGFGYVGADGFTVFFHIGPGCYGYSAIWDGKAER